MPRPRRTLYIPRALEAVVRRAAREFPVVILTGPRQSGKTTLLRHLFDATHDYVSFETPDVREMVLSDPRGFLGEHPGPLILDEVHLVPPILAYVKERVDAARSRPGQFILSGSQNLLLMQSITETLAGRAAILRLMPLSWRERAGAPSTPLPWNSPRSHRTRRGLSTTDFWTAAVRGGYPALWADPRRDARLWHASYVQTYLERDVRTLRQVGDLGEFQRFLRLLAARSAQLMNLAAMSRDLGVALNTVKAWLSVLEASHQVIVLRPYFGNLGKRLVKTPKVYFTDVGLLCHLTGIVDPAHAAHGPLAGALMETAVLSEIIRATLATGEEPLVHFFRTSDQHEVDFLVEHGDELTPIEVKVSSTPNPRMVATLERLREWVGEPVTPGFLVHLGTMSGPLGKAVRALPFAEL
jgi:hypothetical protein